MSEKIDLILYNADIQTLDESKPQAAALAISNGRVVAIGSESDIRAMSRASGADSLDLKGATLVPGLNDAHTHFMSWSQSLQRVNLVGLASLDAVLEKVRSRAQTTPAGGVVRGLGWDKNLWGEDFPTKEALDRAAPDHPVILSSKDGHLLWVNSRALQLAKIDRATPDPAGGEIVRDAQGEATGIFKENATSLFSDLNNSNPTPAEAEAALLEALEAAHRVGITGIHSIEDRIGFSNLQRLHAKGKLKLRTTVMLTNWAIPHIAALGLRQGFGDEMLWLGQIKFFLDGTLGSQTAAMFEPFEHSEDCNCGILRMEPDEFERQAQAAVEAGFGIAVHVIGDRAARLGLDVIEKLQATNPDTNFRHRLEHVQLFKPEDLPRFAHSNIIASVQPIHATSDRDAAEYYWGAERASLSYRYKSLLQSGAHLAMGSDVPIEPIDPRKGLFAAVARRREADARPAWYPNERLSVAEALHGFTQGAAYAAGDETRRGKIAPGFMADFTALRQNIFAAPEDELPVTPVSATFVAGEPVWLE